jgi:hypothetical protein
MSESPPVNPSSQNKSWLPRATAAAAAITGMLGGLAAVTSNIETIKEKIGLFSKRPLNVTLHDVRAIDTGAMDGNSSVVNGIMGFTIAATVEKTGDEAVKCECELLLKNVVLNGDVVFGSSDSNFFAKVDGTQTIPKGTQILELRSYPILHINEYTKHAEFRLKCKTPSPWVPITLPDLPDDAQ